MYNGIKLSDAEAELSRDNQVNTVATDDPVTNNGIDPVISVLFYMYKYSYHDIYHIFVQS